MTSYKGSKAKFGKQSFNNYVLARVMQRNPSNQFK